MAGLGVEGEVLMRISGKLLAEVQQQRALNHIVILQVCFNKTHAYVPTPLPTYLEVVAHSSL